MKDLPQSNREETQVSGGIYTLHAEYFMFYPLGPSVNGQSLFL